MFNEAGFNLKQTSMNREPCLMAENMMNMFFNVAFGPSKKQNKY